jgi:hypothetical protein
MHLNSVLYHILAWLGAHFFQIEQLRSSLLPLLDEADRRMARLKGRHFVNDSSLLRHIAAASGRLIADNAGMLTFIEVGCAFELAS